jgi:hypothetical protein
MSIVGDATALVPVPGVSVIGKVIDFLTSFIKGVTKHATLAQVNAQEHDYRNAIAAAFSAYSSDEQLMIGQKAQPLLLNAMQAKWGLGGQGQPVLASYVQNSAALQDLAGAMFSWIAVNVDASSADEMLIDIKWAWQYVFITAIQQAGLDPLRVKGSSAVGGGVTPGTGTTQAGVGSSLILIVVVVGIMIGILRKGKGKR